MRAISIDGYILQSELDDEPDEDGVLITRQQLAAIHRLADAARHVARAPKLTADGRAQLLVAADEVAEA